MLARFLLPILLCANIYAADTKNQDSQNYEVLKVKIESAEKRENLRHFEYKQNLDAYKDLMKAQQEQNEKVLDFIKMIASFIAGVLALLAWFLKSKAPEWINEKIDNKILADANKAIDELKKQTVEARNAIEQQKKTIR
jgi:uncharacterized surface protein with fasciclin (FAS1) repeats